MGVFEENKINNKTFLEFNENDKSKFNVTQFGQTMEEPGGPRPTVEELQSLTVVKLRQRLAQYGIPQSGNKAALVERLDKFYTDRDAKAQAQQPQSFQSPPRHYGEVP